MMDENPRLIDKLFPARFHFNHTRAAAVNLSGGQL